MSEIEEETIVCEHCGSPVSFHRRSCFVCEGDIGFPNVRKAILEEPQLMSRHSSALTSATARGIKRQFEEFEASFSDSKAVLARSFQQVLELINSENKLYTTYAKDISQSARLAENNAWDPYRNSVDEAIHPHYSENIVFSALSLTDMGVPQYGNCHIVLKSQMIENRASIFEENPFHFMNRHSLIIGKPIPKGYRATWGNRGILAATKLHSSIESSTTKVDYQNLLISGDDKNTDFVEVHIYGAIHARAFEKIVLVGELTAVEQVMLKAYKPKIDESGIELIEEDS